MLLLVNRSVSPVIALFGENASQLGQVKNDNTLYTPLDKVRTSAGFRALKHSFAPVTLPTRLELRLPLSLWRENHLRFLVKRGCS